MYVSVTQADVAREAGVSRTLVSMALSGSPRVAEGTRQHIESVAASLGYTRDLSAATLASASNSPFIGLVVPNFNNPFFEDLIANVDAGAEDSDLLPLIATASNDPAREANIIQRFRELRVRGLAVFTPASSREDLVEVGSKIPLVVIGESEIGGKVDTIRLDETAAARSVLEHARSRRWREVVYLSDVVAQRDRGLARRRSALVSQASALGIKLDVVEFLDDVNTVIAALTDNRSCSGTAFICHNDFLAMEVISALRGRGLRVGKDVAVISYDDTRLAAEVAGNFTSVGQQLERQAQSILELINTRADYFDREARELVFPPSLAERSSS